MHKKFIATIVAAAIAVTSLTAAPVQAGDRGENRRLMIGLLALGAIAAAISEDERKRKKHKATQNQNTHRTYDHDQPHRPKKKKKVRRHAKPLPAFCRRTFDTRNGVKRIFTKRCLKNNYSQMHRLPQRCFFRIKTYNGMRKGYGNNCLRRHGFRVAHY